VSWFRLESLEQPEIGILFKTAFKIDFVFEAIIVIVSGSAWAIAGFPHFTEIATLGSAGLVCFGVYVGIICNLKE
jgi:hypothetical protein